MGWNGGGPGIGDPKDNNRAYRPPGQAPLAILRRQFLARFIPRCGRPQSRRWSEPAGHRLGCLSAESLSRPLEERSAVFRSVSEPHLKVPSH